MKKTILELRFNALIVSVLTLSFFPAHAATSDKGKTVPPDSHVVISVNSARPTIGYTTPPLVPISPTGEWRISSGEHKINDLALIDGREYGLIPWRHGKGSRTGQIRVEDKTDTTGCVGIVQHFAAIDLSSGVMSENTWLKNDSDCDIGDRWGRRVWLVSKQDYSAFRVEKTTVAEIKATEQRARQETQEQLRQQAVRSELEAPAKRMIGATICKQQNGIVFGGYTEQFSPETGKIKIRVAYQFAGGSGQLMRRLDRDEIIWESPDHWYICSF